MTKKTTYVALTTINEDHGFQAIVIGNNKSDVRKVAEEKISLNAKYEQLDAYDRAKLSNLRVVSKTNSKRIFNVDIDHDNFVENNIETTTWL